MFSLIKIPTQVFEIFANELTELKFKFNLLYKQLKLLDIIIFLKY